MAVEGVQDLAEGFVLTVVAHRTSEFATPGVKLTRSRSARPRDRYRSGVARRKTHVQGGALRDSGGRHEPRTRFLDWAVRRRVAELRRPGRVPHVLERGPSERRRADAEKRRPERSRHLL